MTQLKLLLFDVDGVLTDGRILVHGDGTESKQFSIRDGAAIVWAQRAGLRVGLLSARTAQATAVRAAQLGITTLVQGSADKLAGYQTILTGAGLADAQVGYMGDDLQDLPVLRRAGFSAAPADAVPDVRRAVQWVSQSGGGNGAVRECIEHVLRAQGQWRTAVADYLEP
jgi:3-deoxy-D-manno-octulosonate 8-phosphate phosphatase (KDO 8-P phosphatase)